MAKLRVPFDRAAGLAQEIKASLAPGCKRIEVAGSLRRRKPHVGDLEMVAIPLPHGGLFTQAPPDEDLDALLSRLISGGVLREPHLCGPKYRKYESARLAGFFLDFIEITFIHVPVLTPLMTFFGFDPVWFAILIAVNLQTSFLTPPFGYALFYLKSVCPPGVTTVHIYKGIVPFVALQLIALVVVIIFPQMVLWLPCQIFGSHCE